MSPFFVKKFSKENPCKGCYYSRTGSKLCSSHLVQARLAWRVWGARRRHEGLCCSCDRKNVPNNIRCSKHREINRVKCLAWNKANPGHGARMWKKRLETLASGFCICSEHNPLPPGQRRCDTCRVYHRALDTGDKRTLNKIRAQRRRHRAREAVQAARAARRQLKTMGRTPYQGPLAV